MQEDIALIRTQRGKFTFTWDDTGDVIFDNRAVYPVLTTLVTRKGQYYHDAEGNQGTLLYTMKQDKLTTGSQLRSYAQDGGNQVIAEGIITSFSAQAERIRSGSFALQLSWKMKDQSSFLSETVRV